ncbi:MAG TPA: hypothetical protein DCX14_08320 [Flavobacteriales bacterium]|nr:hypothetical protein [Flavobacteriales bacterium]
MKRLGLILIAVLLLVGVGENLFDLADVECHKFEPEPIGYPVRICAITFDDKGIIGKLLD